MSGVYRYDDPRNTKGVWETLDMILSKIKEIEILIDEHFCELDDGYHWTRTPIGEEE